MIVTNIAVIRAVLVRGQLLSDRGVPPALQEDQTISRGEQWAVSSVKLGVTLP